MEHTEIKKMKQGMSYSCKEKTIILNVFKYFRQHYQDLCVTEIVRRTAKATGCSEKSVFQFRKEEKSATGFKEPSKTKIRKGVNSNSRDMKYDQTVRQAIRCIIYGLKYDRITPSLNTILKHVNDDQRLPSFSLMTLRRLLFDMGFCYEKDGKKAVLVEKQKDENAVDGKKNKKVSPGSSRGGGVKRNSGKVNPTSNNSNGISSTDVNSSGLNLVGMNSTGIDSTRIETTGIMSSRLDNTGINSSRLDNTGINSSRVDNTRIMSSRLDNSGINSSRMDTTGINSSAGINSSGLNPTNMNSSRINQPEMNMTGINNSENISAGSNSSGCMTSDSQSRYDPPSNRMGLNPVVHNTESNHFLTDRHLHEMDKMSLRMDGLHHEMDKLPHGMPKMLPPPQNMDKGLQMAHHPNLVPNHVPMLDDHSNRLMPMMPQSLGPTLSSNQGIEGLHHGMHPSFSTPMMMNHRMGHPGHNVPANMEGPLKYEVPWMHPHPHNMVKQQ